MISFPSKQYSIIYADPPWNFKTWGKTNSKHVSNHYSCMDIQDIGNLPVSEITKTHSLLFIWVTFPTLNLAFHVIEDWGFTYKTCAFVWIKTNKNFNKDQFSFLPEDRFDSFWGLGYWTRANTELCLLATKGRPKRISSSVHQLIYDPVREHSRKPDCTRDKIIQLVGDLPRIELFARQRHDGWDCWGNEV
jgi:N6-adenosine-specific RNA methylase IME4